MRSAKVQNCRMTLMNRRFLGLAACKPSVRSLGLHESKCDLKSRNGVHDGIGYADVRNFDEEKMVRVL